jgi:hypothetical protein
MGSFICAYANLRTMAGFVIDTLFGFIARWVMLSWRSSASRNWPALAGRVVRCHFEKHGYGGDFVVHRYKYKVDSQRFEGPLKKPFMYAGSANTYTRRFPADSEIRIHVDPEDSARSFPVFF